jgi:hypothetical protein
MVHFTKIQLSSELLYSVQTPESAMDELSQMLNGKGVYGIPLRTLPSLRFLAFITLCPDCDTHSSTANANAANVGSKGKLTKEAALTCTLTLRKTCETQLLKCRAHSREAEKKFESIFKMEIMPEFAVHHAIHLLAFRPETPSGGLNRRDHESVENYKMLRKRLSWLFDPLVKSLGESADNISFLLRLSEMLGRSYIPRQCGISDKENHSEDTSVSSALPNHEIVLQSKLKVICAAAREVLMKFVKKDVNLTPYPGIIQINATLFAQNKVVSPMQTARDADDEDSESISEESHERTIITDSGKKSELSFSQSVGIISSKLSSSKRDLEELQLSPIPKPASPEFGILKSPGSPGHAKLGRVSFGSPAKAETTKKRNSHSSSLPSSDDKRRRTSSESQASARESRRNKREKTDNSNEEGLGPNRESPNIRAQGDELDFDDDEDVSTSKSKRTNSPRKGKTVKKAAQKMPIKVGKSPKPSRRKVDSPASVSSRSPRSTRSTQSSVTSAGSPTESPQLSNATVRRSSRLSRD